VFLRLRLAASNGFRLDPVVDEANKWGDEEGEGALELVEESERSDEEREGGWKQEEGGKEGEAVVWADRVILERIRDEYAGNAFSRSDIHFS
jgi:hypothetical protein